MRSPRKSSTRMRGLVAPAAPAAVSNTPSASSKKLTEYLSDRRRILRVKKRDHARDALGGRFAVGVALDFGGERRLVRVVEARDAVHLAGAAAAVDALDVALLDDGGRRVHVALDEPA